MMGNNRVLEFRELGRNDAYVVVEITKQSHRGDSFAKDGNHFGCLLSDVNPTFCTMYLSVAVKGECFRLDNTPIVMPMDVYANFCKDVKEYNDTNGGFGWKRWRAKDGECYYYFDDYFSPQVAVERGLLKNSFYYACGNYFKNVEDTKKAIEVIKKYLTSTLPKENNIIGGVNND